MKKFIVLAALFFAATDVLALGRMADITVVDRQQQRTLPVYWHEGRAYVEGRPGNEYAIAIHNRLGQDLLAVVSVDGVNVVTGETAAPSQGGYVVDQWQHLDIEGWRKDLSRTAAFYFTALNDSYAARTGRPQNVGVIGAALYRRKTDRWSSHQEPKLDRRERSKSEFSYEAERGMNESSGIASSALRAPASSMLEKQLSPLAPLGTGHGRSELSEARSVNFERASNQPEEIVTIYYDSRANLIARGIIKESVWQPREPQPFPQRFVPDPPRRW